MKKIVMAVICAALAVAFNGCGKGDSKSSDDEAQKNDSGVTAGEPKRVAEAYAEALCKRDLEKVMSLRDTIGATEKQIKEAKEMLEKEIKEDSNLNDHKLKAEAAHEMITVSPGYKIIDGQKYTGKAMVTVHFMRGRDKKSFGLRVELVKVDGKWKVTDHDKIEVDEDE